MAEQFNLGIIGCGGIAKGALLPAAAEVDEFNLCAFMDVDEARAAEACETFGGTYHTTDMPRLIEDEALDAILVCTLPDTHAPIGKAVLEAGKHAFLQKPVAINKA